MPELPLPEEEILRALLQTDEAKFMEYLFRKYYGPLCKAVNRIIQDPDAAEDLVQDVFLKVWHNRQQLEISTSYKAYLYRAATNASFNYLEKQKRLVHEELPEKHPVTLQGNPTEEQLYLLETEQKVQQGLEALPPKCRAVFTLSRFDELSYQQIAEALEISVKTVENQMGKALKILRNYLGVLLSLILFLNFQPDFQILTIFLPIF